MERRQECCVNQIQARWHPARLSRAELPEEGGRDGTKI
jgi:hypothetical protein